MKCALNYVKHAIKALIFALLAGVSSLKIWLMTCIELVLINVVLAHTLIKHQMYALGVILFAYFAMDIELMNALFAIKHLGGYNYIYTKINVLLIVLKVMQLIKIY